MSVTVYLSALEINRKYCNNCSALPSRLPATLPALPPVGCHAVRKTTAPRAASGSPAIITNINANIKSANCDTITPALQRNYPRNMAKQSTPPARYTPGWLADLDKRTAVAQEMARRFDEVATDLGGADRLSYLARSLVSRYLWSEYWIQQQERAIAEGREVDMGRYTQAVNSATGLANKLGLDRVARDVPDLQTFLQKRQQGGAQ